MRKVCLAIGVVVIAVALGSPSADAATKRVSKTNTQNQSIDNNTSTTSVNVKTRGRVLDVNVRLYELSHNIPEELVIILEHGSRSVVLWDNTGGSQSITSDEFTIDDEAANFMADIGPVPEGTYKPTHYQGAFIVDPPPKLRRFDGKSSRGEWRLLFRDDVPGDLAHLGGWELKLKVATA